MMMQSCSVCNVVGGSCSCGWFHNQSINSFSMLFSGGPNNTNTQNYFDTTTNYQSDIYSSYYSASPLPAPAPAPPYSSVDCTLSLGTPSTRLSNNENCSEKRRSSCVSKFCSWDFLKHGGGTHESSSSSSQKNNNNNRASNYYSGGGDGRGAGDSLSARRCANCDTTSTPLWRNGPKGPKSLCNACGIRHKKEERRASAAAASAAAATNDCSAATGGAVDNYQMHNSSSWVHQYSQNQKLPYFSSAYAAAGNEFRFMEEEDARDADGIPYLSWRFNVADNRPAALVHDFTR